MTTDKCTKDINTKLKGKLQVDNKFYSLIINKKQIRTTAYHFSLIKLAI